MAEFSGIPPDTSSSVFCAFSIPQHKQILLSANAAPAKSVLTPFGERECNGVHYRQAKAQNGVPSNWVGALEERCNPPKHTFPTMRSPAAPTKSGSREGARPAMVKKTGRPRKLT